MHHMSRLEPSKPANFMSVSAVESSVGQLHEHGAWQLAWVQWSCIRSSQQHAAALPLGTGIPRGNIVQSVGEIKMPACGPAHLRSVHKAHGCVEPAARGRAPGALHAYLYNTVPSCLVQTPSVLVHRTPSSLVHSFLYTCLLYTCLLYTTPQKHVYTTPF